MGASKDEIVNKEDKIKDSVDTGSFLLGSERGLFDGEESVCFFEAENRAANVLLRPMAGCLRKNGIRFFCISL